MKNKNKTRVMSVVIVILIVALAYTWYYNPREVIVPVEKEVEVFVPVSQPVRQTPEYRGPPIKKYKPGYMQQMGLLVGDGQALPLYGKEASGYRDRYNYYTTTTGEQMYPVPVTHDGRECTEDIGCPEFYGEETVDILGKNAPYTVKMYRTDDFF